MWLAARGVYLYEKRKRCGKRIFILVIWIFNDSGSETKNEKRCCGFALCSFKILYSLFFCASRLSFLHSLLGVWLEKVTTRSQVAVGTKKKPKKATEKKKRAKVVADPEDWGNFV
jgi:hypothetical protein